MSVQKHVIGVYDVRGEGEFFETRVENQKGDKTHYIWSVKYKKLDSSHKKHPSIADLNPRDYLLLS